MVDSPAQTRRKLALLVLTALETVELPASSRPDKTCYENRALAESIKTPTWRHISDAELCTTTSDRADRELVERISTLQHDNPTFRPAVRSGSVTPRWTTAPSSA